VSTVEEIAGLDEPDIDVREIGAEHAADVLALIHSTFAGRPVLDPPATALDETLESVAAALETDGGLLATIHGHPVGALLFDEREQLLGLRRVGVVEEVRHHGVAPRLTAKADEVAAARGLVGLRLEARAELPVTVRFWQRQGYVEAGREGPRLTMLRLFSEQVVLPRPEDTQRYAERLGKQLRAGDLVILTGDLGAGKTTFTQGLGRGLGVRGNVTSPTFVIARVHPSLTDGPPLVHVDAYRLGGAPELDDLDLDTDLDEAVTVVEWGSGLAEALAGSRLEVRLERATVATGLDQPDVRTLTLTPVGPRWLAADRRGLLAH
jgi:tRNA threonylcarbamoyladenosine biosynthesis protein TsaE